MLKIVLIRLKELKDAMLNALKSKVNPDIRLPLGAEDFEELLIWR